MRKLIGMLSMAAVLCALPAAAGDELDEFAVQPSTRDSAFVESPGAPSDQPQASPGQWVYTSQYGWVWMPYDNGYTYAPPDGSTPDMYVYGPEIGWCWVVAPWLWGWGPAPYFGVAGPRWYGWYGHGLGRWYGYQGRYNHLAPAGRVLGAAPRVGVSRSFGNTFRGGAQTGPGERGGAQIGSGERGGAQIGSSERGGFRSGGVERSGGFHGGESFRKP